MKKKENKDITCSKHIFSEYTYKHILATDNKWVQQLQNLKWTKTAKP